MYNLDMKEKIKTFCLILLTITALIIAWRYWVYTADYSRLVDEQTKFKVENYTK
jgi:regulatory protein YycH of two-component signal transduction system YycFG